MEKRVERNKALYKRVNEENGDFEAKKNNDHFKGLVKNLDKVDPSYFGSQEKKEIKEKKKSNLGNIFFLLALLLILLGIGVIIYYATK